VDRIHRDIQRRIDARLEAELTEEESETPDEAFALSCSDLAEKLAPSAPEVKVEAEQPASRRRRVGLLRMHELLQFLMKWFGCEVRGGKGSEISIYRPVGRMFTLKRHTQNPEVSGVMVRRLLRRLEIPEKDWLRAVYG
jgi:hypothetical protein